MNKIIKIILFLLAIITLAFVIVIGINRQEITTCHQYEKWAEEYPLFYLTEWEKEMCDAHNIPIDAEVK